MASPGLTFRLGANSKARSGERWKETRTYSEVWLLETDVENYSTDLDSTLAALWIYVAAERLNNAEVGLHYSVTLENTTAPTPPAGGLVQAKQHFDGGFASDEWDDGVAGVKDQLVQTVQVMLHLAKYDS